MIDWILDILLIALTYLAIGCAFERFGPSDELDVETILLWPFSLDIHVRYWLEMRRIQREGARRLAEAERARKKDT